MPPPDHLRALATAVGDASPDGLLVVDGDGVILYANRRFGDLWGVDVTTLAAVPVDTLLGKLADAVVDPNQVLAAGRGETVGVTLLDGRVFDRSGAPLFADDGTRLGWAWYFRDVTAHRRIERDLRELAGTLRSTLLPPRPPEIPGMEVATRFRPADIDVNVGGDFFDVFRLSTNDWGLAIGDVCGKGARAAALSTLTRYTLRAAAIHDELPSDVLAEVNRVLATEPEADDRFCSVAFARLQLDTCGAWVTLSCAGHPRPIVVRRAGWIDHRGQAGSLLGMFDGVDLSDDRVGLGPGDAIVFCTDGIFEARNRAGEMFADELLDRVLLDSAGSDADTIAGRLTTEAMRFAGGHSADDVAVLVVRVPDDAAVDPDRRLATAMGVERGSLPLPGFRVGDEYVGLRDTRPAPPRDARARFAGERASAKTARRFVAGVLDSWRMSELVGGDAELLVSELVSNAVHHTRGSITVAVRYDGERVRIEVGDESSTQPELLHVPADATGGRGLFLVDSISSSWGVTPAAAGKLVWFELPAPDPRG